MRNFQLLERVSYHVNRRVTSQDMRKQYRIARSYARSFNNSWHLPCGYQDHYGEKSEAAAMEARAMGIAWMIHTHGGCRKFGELLDRLKDDFGGEL